MSARLSCFLALFPFARVSPSARGASETQTAKGDGPPAGGLAGNLDRSLFAY